MDLTSESGGGGNSFDGESFLGGSVFWWCKNQLQGSWDFDLFLRVWILGLS